MPESLFAPLAHDAPSMLMAGEFAVVETGAGLAAGFRRIGWDVAEVELTRSTIHSDSVALRAAGRVLRPTMLRSYNRAILKAAERLRPQVFLTVKGSFIASDTLRRLRAMGIATVNFYPDYRFDHGRIFDETMLADYDLVVTTKSFQVDYLQHLLGPDRVAMVHHGYSPFVHRRREPAGGPGAYLWDVCYIGNASPYKLAWLEPLARSLDGRSMIVFGDRWVEQAAGTAVARYVFGAPLNGDHFARAVEHSRINLSFHMGAGGPHGWSDLVSTRSFEIPACGGFMLHVDNAEIRELFDAGREMDVFADANELTAKVHYYLAHDAERRAIAAAGHDRAVPAYSLIERAVEIDAILSTRGFGK